MNSTKLSAKTFALNSDWGRPGCGGVYGGVGWYRIINGWEKVGADVQKGEFRLKIGQAGAEGALELKERGDIWITKPMDGVDVVRTLLVDKEFVGAKFVLDLDDDPFNVDEKHPNYEHFKERAGLYKEFIRSSDHIICATQPLADLVKPINPRISIIPNTIDPEIWKVKKKKRKDGKIRIGWFGSASHFVELPMAMEIVDEILEKYPQVEFHLAGMTGKDTNEGRIFNHKGTKGYEEYPQWVADKDLDIAIAPLLDNQFNSCKSNIKWLEHSMLKTPMVLSDVKPYSDSVKNYKTGYLAKNKSQWIKYLGWLIESEDKRKEIGEKAYKEVCDKWLIEKHLDKYYDLVDKVREKDIAVYTSVTGKFDKLLDYEVKDALQVAFTDQESDIWEIRKPYDRFTDPRRNSRIQKMMPHLYFNHKYTIYLDGNIELKVPAQKLVDEWLKDKDIAVFRHIGRDCIYDEAQACVSLEKEKPEELSPQIKEYARRGILAHAGLAECGVIVRRNTPEVNRMNEKWFAEYCRFGCRDQISFPVAFDLDKVNLIESSVWRHPYFKYNGGH